MPLQGLAVALILGVVLAVGAVAFFAALPASVELTGASRAGAAENQTKTTTPAEPANSSQQGVTNTTVTGGGAVYMSFANSTNNLPISSIASAISPPASSAAKTNESGTAATDLSPTYSPSQQRSVVVATAQRDALLFASAGALAIAAFLLLRRRMA